MVQSPAPRLTMQAPPSHWLFGHFRDMRAQPLQFLTRCAEEHGDAVALRFGHRRVLLLSHPSLIAEVLVAKNGSFRKHFALRSAKMVLHDGLLTSEGEQWRSQRRMLQPSFHGDRLRHYARIMVDQAQRQVASWPLGRPFDVHARLMGLTAGVVSLCLFGTSLGEDASVVERTMSELTECFRLRLNHPLSLLSWLPTSLNRRTRRAARQIDQVLSRILAERRRAPVGPDLLSGLITTHGGPEAVTMSDPSLRDHMVTLFFAGHETTANALAWTLWLLSQGPHEETALANELEQVLGGRSPTWEDIPLLPRCAAVIEESMRLRPPAWVFGRESIEDVTIGTLALPRRTTVLISPWVVQRDPRWYANPLVFRPDRWLDPRKEDRPEFAYLPFGGGPRLCIGMGFARMELILVLATIMQRLQVRLSPDARVDLNPTITLRPREGMLMTASQRGSSTSRFDSPHRGSSPPSSP